MYMLIKAKTRSPTLGLMSYSPFLFIAKPENVVLRDSRERRASQEYTMVMPRKLRALGDSQEMTEF